MGFAIDEVRAALDAAVGLAEARTGRRPEQLLADSDVAAAFMSERHARSAGWTGGTSFAALSRFARTADGWIRLHANYPQHRAAVLAVLGDADPVGVAATRTAVELESAIVAAGGCAGAVRTAAEWAQSAPGRAATMPHPRRRLRPGRGLPAPTSGLPASGLRVLDLTRVIAGPVGGRFLATLGAEVTRMDPPKMPELAWGIDGPWGSRRGFDSIVQAACGIADALAGPDGAPAALPVQALDHASGYRVATAVLEGLRSRARKGVAQHAWIALASTAADLMRRVGDRPWPEVRAPHMQDLGDEWMAVRPPGSLDGVALSYP